MTVETINKRGNQRVPTSFPCAFSVEESEHQFVRGSELGYENFQNQTIIGTGHVLDLSEEGLFAQNIIVFNHETKREIDRPEIVWNKLYNLTFSLQDNSKVIETDGQFARQYRNNGSLYAAVKFIGMSSDNKEIIKEYVNSHIYC